MSVQNTPETETSLTQIARTAITKNPAEKSSALNEIINNSIAHIQTSKTLDKLRRIGEHQLQWPDYQLVYTWAEQLGMQEEALLMILLGSIHKHPKKFKTTLVDGRFVNLVIDSRLNQIVELPAIEGLSIEMLSLERYVRKLGWGAGHLAELDLSRVPKLLWLECGFNELATLDLSPVPNLRVLRCFDNKITEIDLDPVPKLKVLDCSHNGITNLNLYPVPNLEELNCEFNRIKELDLSAVPNLIELECSGNQLTHIDLIQVPNLTFLSCSNNQLPNLDLSHVPGLNLLACAGNKFTELDITPLQLLGIHSIASIDTSTRLIHRSDQKFR